ncbi:hypothetical protein [Candidatus Williamhamiltonella defendens]|uniref:Uncharacterized protein n=2 Tax=Candidatus Williamhamiltonella defendens TaxID=138072 RepID=A0A249DXS2_9ENTR|nr:hypothetical protein [Candidatus Hamiltonella defensa]ASX26343.1 hypothetical protein BA171_04495 [Candidatus Hamiltonella defensa (Bemisia tabaci)]
MISFIGLGNITYTVLKMIKHTFINKDVHILIYKNKNQHNDFITFCKKIVESHIVTFQICETYFDCILNSDIIISSITFFDGNIAQDNAFKEGCLLVPIHTRGFMNCDLFFNKVFFDDFSHVSGFKYYYNFKNKAHEVSDVVNGISFWKEKNIMKELYVKTSVLQFTIYI